jgi:hypothetical protein
MTAMPTTLKIKIPEDRHLGMNFHLETKIREADQDAAEVDPPQITNIKILTMVILRTDTNLLRAEMVEISLLILDSSKVGPITMTTKATTTANKCPSNLLWAAMMNQ